MKHVFLIWEEWARRVEKGREQRGRELGGSFLIGRGYENLFHILRNEEEGFSGGGSGPTWGRVVGVKERALE